MTLLRRIKSNRWSAPGSALTSVIIGFAILAFLFTLGGETRCAHAQASCNVGDDETFAGNMTFESGTGFGLVIDHSNTATQTVTYPLDHSGEHTFNTATQTLTAKSFTSPVITGSPTAAGATWVDLGAVTTADINAGTVDATIGGTAPATGDFTAVTATTLDGILGSVTPASATVTTLNADDTFISDGNGVVIGHTAQVTTFNSQAAEFQVLGNTAPDSMAAVARFSNDGAAGEIVLGNSRAASPAAHISTPVIIQDGDTAGSITGVVDDGVDMASRVGSLRFEVDGTPGANDTPGRIRLLTTADGSANPTERMRISSDGGVSFSVLSGDPATIANQAHIYSKDVTASGEIFVQDEAGNATQISPHDPLTNKWYFNSCNVFTGRCVEIDMEGALLALELLTGETFVSESFIPAVDRQDWDTVEAGKQGKAQAVIAAWDARIAAGADPQELGPRPDSYIARGKPAWLP